MDIHTSIHLAWVVHFLVSSRRTFADAKGAGEAISREMVEARMDETGRKDFMDWLWVQLEVGLALYENWSMDILYASGR